MVTKHGFSNSKPPRDTVSLIIQSNFLLVTTGYYSSVVSKFVYDAEIVDPNSCIETYYTDILSTLVAGVDGIVDVVT